MSQRSLANYKVSDISLAIALILAFKPYLLQLNGGDIETLWDVATVLVSCCFIIAVIISKKLKAGHIFLVLFCMIYCISTYLYTPSNVFGSVSESLRICLAFYCITYCFSNSRISPIRIVKCVSILLLLLDFIIGILNFAHPFLDDANYSLFGLDNYAIFYLLPLLSMVTISDFIIYGKISLSFTVVFIMTLGLKIATGAVTSVIALLVFGCVLYLIRYKAPFALLPLNNYFWLVCVLVFTIGVVVFEVQNFFIEILNMMGRDATLSFRTVIWSKTIDAIMASPIIGYGKTGPGIFQITVGLSAIYDLQATHAHNYILELLFDSGLCGTALFAAFLYFSLKKPSDIKQINKVLLAGYAGLLGFALLMFTDSYIFTPGLYCLLAIIKECTNNSISFNTD